MIFKEISFNESLEYIHYSLSHSGYNGISIDEIIELSDFETKKLLRDNNNFQDPLGNEILKSQILKNFSINNSYNIVLRNNICDLINLLDSKIPELKIDNNINQKDEIYNFLNNYKSKETSYFVDLYGLDYSKIISKNIIFLSSIKHQFGIKNLGVAWLITNDIDLYNKLKNKIEFFGPSISYNSEILSIIALRNSFYIRKINEDIVKKNYDYLNIFLNEMHESIESKTFFLNLYSSISFKNIDSQDIINNAKKMHRMLIRDNNNNIIIHFGNKNFIPEFSIFSSLVKNLL